MSNNPKNTNNSLTDLTNVGLDFNESLSNNQKKDNNKKKDELTEAKSYWNKRKASGEDKEGVSDEFLNLIQEEENKINNDSSITTSDSSLSFSNKSLYDGNAIIDYGRFLQSDGTVQRNWKQYNDVSISELTSNKIFEPNNFHNINEVVPYSDSSLDSVEGLSLPNIIEWSENYPALQLKGQDFAYCKRLGYYPNNRLIVLRRFKSGVPDNLFDHVNTSTSKIEYSQPLSTMVTWWKPEDEIGDISFSEEWETYKKGVTETVKESVNDLVGGTSSSSDGKDDDKGIIGNLAAKLPFNDLVTSLTGSSLSEGFQKEDGVPYSHSFMGSPNSVYEAMVRKVGGNGLSSKIEFSLEFEYEMRDINNIDPGIAILDLISNCLRMGTSVSEFRYNMPILKEADSVKALINGDISKFTNIFFEDLKKVTENIKDTFNTFVEDVSNALSSIDNLKNAAGNVLTNTAEFIISRYRENLKGALSVDTGLPSGIWHVTIGNPKAPIISCGDLIIRQSKLKLGKELGYNDFPNEFKVTYTLESARTRGRQEIENILNSGRGRIYVYPDAQSNPDYDLYSSGDNNKNNN